MKSKRVIDWEAIEKHFRGGVLSIREIAKMHDVSDKAIRNKAKEKGWERNLSEKINDKVKSELVRGESALADQKTESEIVDLAAATVVQVVRDHRKRIRRSTEIVELLAEQLYQDASNREQIEEDIIAETREDKTLDRRSRMLKAVSLSSHSGVALNLVNAQRILVGLERQAFSIKDESAPEANPLSDLIKSLNGTGLEPIE